jgi:hypothetical protein
MPQGALRTRLIPCLGLCAVAALVCAGFGTCNPADATARLEQLAGKIERAAVLHPDTARQLEQLMDMPQFDCARVPCNTELQTRNQAARERLRQSIARKIHPGEVVAAGHADN